MRKYLSCVACLLLVLLLGNSATSFAQAKDTTKKKIHWTAEERADKMSDKLDRRLNLTNDQDKKIHEINVDITRRIDAVKANTSLQKKDKMQQIKSLNEERGQRFKSVLTADQYKKWNDWEMQKKEKMEAKMDKKQQKRNS
jgi:Spy/CpxP family protein refolding chaperone